MSDGTTTEVEQTDAGWQVVLVVDGERRRQEQVHPTREKAEIAAREISGATDRWEGAPAVEDPPAEEPHESH